MTRRTKPVSASSTLPPHMIQQTYEIWIYSKKQWTMRATRETYSAAMAVAETFGYPFFAVVRCNRTLVAVTP